MPVRGWGSCFADFNADGYPDLLVVNGMLGGQAVAFNDDPVRLFQSGRRSLCRGCCGCGHSPVPRAGSGSSVFGSRQDGDTDAFIQNGYGQSRILPPMIHRFRRGFRCRFAVGNQTHRLSGAECFCCWFSPTLRRDIVAGNHFLSASPSDIQFAIPEVNATSASRFAGPPACRCFRLPSRNDRPFQY